jgi:hypothetical protein
MWQKIMTNELLVTRRCLQHPRGSSTQVRLKDEFTDLPISRQRKYQLRMQKQRRCIVCGESAVTAAHCLFHAIQSRERNRKRSDAIFPGTGGVANGTHYVSTSTNLTAPRTTWTALCTNCFDAGGSYSFVAALTPSTTRFFLIAIP